MDVGNSSLLALEKHIDPVLLDTVLLSHYHHDHIADLGVLQFTRLLKKDNKGNRSKKLFIYGYFEDEANF